MKKLAIVTGANRGIGQAIAAALWKRGLEVIATHPFDDPDEARRLLAEVGGTEASSPFKAIDIRQRIRNAGPEA